MNNFDKPTNPQLTVRSSSNLTSRITTPLPQPDADSRVTQIAPAQNEVVSVPLTMPGYRILGVLGRGGMGVVYHAIQEKLHRPVALKMVLSRRQTAPEDLVRFLVEGEVIAGLEHPNIVKVYEFGTHAGDPYFSLELLDGGSLDQMIRDNGLSPARAAEIVEQLAGAIQFAHSKGVLHRDLKPANILFSSNGIPKVTDFGLACRGVSDLTRSGLAVGTPSYMAPESALGNRAQIGPHTDVYALGAILYEALTGQPPFLGNSALDTLEQVRSKDPLPPRNLNPNIPRDLETITLKCLQKEPRRRYPSAAALADDLRCWREGRPISARPVGTFERLRKWLFRHPSIAATLTTFLVMLLVVAIIVIDLIDRAVHAEQLADLAKGEAQRARAMLDDAIRYRRFPPDERFSETAAAAWRRGDRQAAAEALKNVPDDIKNWEVRFLRRELTQPVPRGAAGGMIRPFHGLHGMILDHAGEVMMIRLSDDRQILIPIAGTRLPRTTVRGSRGERIFVATPAGVSVRTFTVEAERLFLPTPMPVIALYLSPDENTLIGRTEFDQAYIWQAPNDG